MDKNKSRTDLLAAGRKKLQQFRQKKDSKGGSSHGKSSKQASKSEQHESDADAASTTAKSTMLSQVVEGEMLSQTDSNLETVDSSISCSMESSVATDIDIMTVDPSSISMTPEMGMLETASDHNAKICSQEVGVHENDMDSSKPNEEKNTLIIDDNVTTIHPLAISDFPNSVGGTKHDDTFLGIDVSDPSAIVDPVDAMPIIQESESINREEWSEPSPSQEETPDTSLIPVRGDQVTEVGAMQESYGLGSKQFGGITDVGAEEDGQIALSGPGAETAGGESLEQSGAKEAASQLKEADGLDDTSASVNAKDILDGSLASLTVSEEDRALGVITDKEVEVANMGLDMVPGSGHCGNDIDEVGQADRMDTKASNQQYLFEEHFTLLGENNEKQLANSSQGWTISPPGDVCPISFLQLIEVIKGLSEDEYRLLLESWGSNAELGTGSLISQQHHLPGLLEKLKEELFLTNCTKDILHLQLSEQSVLETENDLRFHQMDHEISVLQASLKEAHDRSNYLAEELAECGSELQATVSGREELQHQFHAAKAEVDDISARAYELQNRLEKSESDLLSLSRESADSKDLAAVLQVEIENLNGILSSLMDERNKLSEEKESCLHVNENLLKELADCKNLVAALQAESSNLNGILTSVTEEREKLEREKEYLANWNVKLSVELSNCKSLVEAMQEQNANLSGNLAMLTEERNKFEDEKMYSIHENEKLSSELLVLHERLSKDQGECMRFEVELEEVMMRLEQLTEENIFLNSSLDVYKAHVREIDDYQAQMLSQVGEAASQVGSLVVQSSGCENTTDDVTCHRIPGKQVGTVIHHVGEKLISDSIAEGPAELSQEEVFDDSSGLVVLKGHLDKAEKIMQFLENVVEGMNSHSASMNRSGGKVSSPAVSKLIQAFESKVHHDEYDGVEDRSVAEDEADAFALAKKHTQNLKALLSQLSLDVKNAHVVFELEQEGRSAANLTIKELRLQFEALKEHADDLEAMNIELGVLYEAVNQCVYGVKERNYELEVQHEALMQQDNSLKAENCEFGQKLCDYESKVKELQGQLQELQKNSDEMTSLLHFQLENLQKEAAERVLTAEQEWNSMAAHIVEIVERLDDSIGFTHTSTTSTGSYGSSDITSRVAASINAATKMIEDLEEKLGATLKVHEETFSLFKEVNDKCNELLGKNELANGLLHKLYCGLKALVADSHGSVEETENNIQDEELPDPLDYSVYKVLMEQLETFLVERQQFQSLNNKLNFELMSRTKDIEELNRRSLDLSSIQRLVEDVEGVVNLEDAGVNLDRMPISRLESLVSFLVHKYKEHDELVSSSREALGVKEMELGELKDKMHQLASLKLQDENEVVLLKERLSQVEEALFAVRSELQEKISELGQSEQRVSSIREKLSIAVAKGKGLIVQRDSLKQSLAETSSELERCSQELQLKDARLNEVETKLKTYSEAGERVEALESELSYIRNSATALRESFLLKDSLLQRIEEILEDLDMPEHFHSRDIIEKVDWLARSATANSLPPIDWDQKSSVGGSYSDAGFVVTDPWKEDAQPSSNSGDDLRRKYEELQNKFYGLAEQNEMLEQSLMERNHLVQRWEELLDRINMPSHLRSAEPEDRIEWLGGALSEANHDRNSMVQKIHELENYCGSLTADLEDSVKRASSLNIELQASQKRISDLDKDLQAVIHVKENFAERLEILTSENETLSAKAVEFELDNEKLLTEVSNLKEKLVDKLGNEERIQVIDGELRRLQDLICDALQESKIKDLNSGVGSIECLERLLRMLIEEYKTLSLVKLVPVDVVEHDHAKISDEDLIEGRTRDTLDATESDLTVIKRDIGNNEENVNVLNKKLEEALSELMHVKEERDRYIEMQHSLVSELEAIDKKRVELQELLYQEEQKSASVREKLNVAVRKGKSLVQQRDSLKQTIEGMNSELEYWKSEIKRRENALLDCEQKMRELPTYAENVEALESESLLLRSRLAETEQLLQDKGHTLAIILNALGDIDVDGEIYHDDPIEKLEHIRKLCHDLHAAVAMAEQESKKSGRAAELLLAELNEVQDRNDGLQEELAKVTIELSELSKERNTAEAAKLEAFSRLEKLSTVHSEEKKKQYSELLVLKSASNKLWKSVSDINDLLSGVFSKELEFLENLVAGMETCLQRAEANHVVNVPLFNASDGITSSNSENKESFLPSDLLSESSMPDNFGDNSIIEVCGSLQESMNEIGTLKVMLHKHSVTLHEQAHNVSKLMGIFQRETISQKELFDVMIRDMKQNESIEKEKEMEIVMLRRNIALLYDACKSSLMEIESRKAEVVGNTFTAGDLGINLESATFTDGGENISPCEEPIRSLAEKLLLVVRDFASLKGEIMEGNSKEMKITITNLQKELQEKDIQTERICMELVGQIKEAEAAKMSYSQDLQSSRTRVHDLEKQVQRMEGEQNLLEQREKELQEGKAILTDLQERVGSLTNILNAKDQEIEVLMQALDEEEIQMENLTSKVKELEKVVQQKNSDIENLEAARGKVLKKLSITVGKFDELHHFSQSLLVEVEKLHSQLQDRDAEISFLRQEVTRCTSDVLAVSQMGSKGNSDEIHELLKWLDALASQLGMQDVHIDDSSQVHEYKEILQKKINSILSKFEDLRVVAQSRDSLLQMERSKVEELTYRVETLQKSLHEKESQLSTVEGVGDLEQLTNSASEIMKVEPLINKWAVPGPSTASQVRSLRKMNNDQVAIAIDMDHGGASRLEDEDDDKVHGFKSLSTSRIVPKFTRRATDRIDGLWVSCDRALMRQPALRLGIIIYWAILHALLATFVV